MCTPNLTYVFVLWCWWGEKLKDKGHLVDLGVDGKIILKLMLNTERGRRLDSCGLVEGQVAA